MVKRCARLALGRLSQKQVILWLPGSQNDSIAGAGEYLRLVTGLPELPPELTLEQFLKVPQEAVHLDSGCAVTAHIIHPLQHHVASSASYCVARHYLQGRNT